MIATPKFCKCEECKGSGQCRPFEYQGETITACPWCQGSGKTEISYVVRSHGWNGECSFTEIETVTDTLEEAKVYAMALMTTRRFEHVLEDGKPTVQWVEVEGPGIEESLGLEPVVRGGVDGRYEWIGDYSEPELVGAEFECHSCGASGVDASHVCVEAEAAAEEPYVQRFVMEDAPYSSAWPILHVVRDTATGEIVHGPDSFRACYAMGRELEAANGGLPPVPVGGSFSPANQLLDEAKALSAEVHAGTPHSFPRWYRDGSSLWLESSSGSRLLTVNFVTRQIILPTWKVERDNVAAPSWPAGWDALYRGSLFHRDGSAVDTEAFVAAQAAWVRGRETAERFAARKGA